MLRAAIGFCCGLLVAAGDLLAAAPPTFTADVAPIVFQNCAGCHRPGEAAPFPLLSYPNVKKRARLIVKVTGDRTMPPWKADHSDFIHFVGERQLSPGQIDTLRRWYEAGCPEGDPKLLPPLPKFVAGWQLGQPDLVVRMPEAYTLRADGPDVFRAFVVPIPIPEAKWVRAVEFHAGNPRVVHHSIWFLDDKGQARKLDAQDPEPGYPAMGGPKFRPSGTLGGWAVGAQPVPFPDGIARRITPGTDLVLQTHLHPSGKVEQERSEVGLYFSKTPPTKFMTGLVLGNRNIDIAPGDSRYVVTSELTLPIDVDLMGITPHAHQVCRTMRVTATLPGGRKEDLLHIRDWDFNWQEQYRCAEPVSLPAGTVLKMTYVYDNSDANDRNPNHPPRRIRFGEQSTDEMAFCFMQVVPKKPRESGRLVGAMLMQKRSGGLADRLLGRRAAEQ